MERSEAVDLCKNARSVIAMWRMFFVSPLSETPATFTETDIDVAADELQAATKDVKSMCDYIINTKDSSYLADDLLAIRKDAFDIAKHIQESGLKYTPERVIGDDGRPYMKHTPLSSIVGNCLTVVNLIRGLKIGNTSSIEIPTKKTSSIEIPTRKKLGKKPIPFEDCFSGATNKKIIIDSLKSKIENETSRETVFSHFRNFWQNGYLIRQIPYNAFKDTFPHFVIPKSSYNERWKKLLEDFGLK